MSTLETLEEEVQILADEKSAEILPRLYHRLMARDGLGHCPRHDMLHERIRAEVALTKAKRGWREYYPVGHPHYCSGKRLDRALTEALRVRREYRSRPCTCYVPHR